MKHKRVERIWRQEGLKVPERQPKRGRLWLNDGSCIRLRPLYRGHVWSYDFVASRTHDGRALKLLTVGHADLVRQPLQVSRHNLQRLVYHALNLTCPEERYHNLC